MRTWWRKEPAALLGLVQIGLTLGATFGLNLSKEETGGLLTGITALLSLLIRSRVSPAQPPAP